MPVKSFRSLQMIVWLICMQQNKYINWITTWSQQGKKHPGAFLKLFVSFRPISALASSLVLQPPPFGLFLLSTHSQIHDLHTLPCFLLVFPLFLSFLLPLLPLVNCPIPITNPNCHCFSQLPFLPTHLLLLNCHSNMSWNLPEPFNSKTPFIFIVQNILLWVWIVIQREKDTQLYSDWSVYKT